MLNKLTKLFNTYSDAVICEVDGKIAYLNKAAELSFRNAHIGGELGEVFPKIPLDSPADAFSFTTGTDGACVSVCRIDDIRVFTITRPDDGHKQFVRLYSHLGETLKSTISVYQMAAGLVRPVLETYGDEQTSAYAAMMSRSGYSILRTASNITRLGDLDNDKPVVFNEAFDIVSLCHKLYASVSRIISASCAELRFESSLRMAPVYGRAAQIEEAVLNLLSNSLKYTPSGGVITLSVSRSNNNYLITVSDSGCGIKPQAMGSVFARYKEPRDTSDAKCGVGLGLMIVRHIAYRHGGNLFIESQEDIGTRAVLILPAAEPPARMCDSIEPYDIGLHQILTVLSDVLPAECFAPQYLD